LRSIFGWSEQHLDDIRLITPMHVAAYIEHHPGSPQTINQHLAAIKMLFDYLVISQIVPTNPAAPCRQTGQNAGLKR
jgi:integrase/recombinase XerD